MMELGCSNDAAVLKHQLGKALMDVTLVAAGLSPTNRTPTPRQIDAAAKRLNSLDER